MYPNVHCSTRYNSQDLEATQKSTDRGMDKEAAVHLYNGILPSRNKNAFESVLMRWMNLEHVTQSEVSQKEKNKYHIFMHIQRIQKDGTDESVRRAAVEMQTQRTELRVGEGEEEGEGEINGESSMEPYTLTIRNCCMTQGTQTGAL